MEKLSKGIIILLILALLIGYGVGFISGGYAAIKVGVHLASGFVDLDEKMIADAIYMYKNNIGQCFPPKF